MIHGFRSFIDDRDGTRARGRGENFAVYPDDAEATVGARTRRVWLENRFRSMSEKKHVPNMRVQCRETTKHRRLFSLRACGRTPERAFRIRFAHFSSGTETRAENVSFFIRNQEPRDSCDTTVSSKSPNHAIRHDGRVRCVRSNIII